MYLYKDFLEGDDEKTSRKMKGDGDKCSFEKHNHCGLP